MSSRKTYARMYQPSLSFNTFYNCLYFIAMIFEFYISNIEQNMKEIMFAETALSVFAVLINEQNDTPEIWSTSS